MALRETQIDVGFDIDIDQITSIDNDIDKVVSNVTGSLSKVENNVNDVAGGFGDMSSDAVSDIKKVDKELDKLGSGNPIQPLKTDMDGLERSNNDAKKSVKQLGEEFQTSISGTAESAVDGITGKIGKMSLALAGAAGVGLGATALAADATGYQKALNSLQAQTGATGAEMDILADSIKNVYSQNLGESMDDVANAMSIVKQVTGQTGKELESTTKNALLMRDTFGFEVNESIRASNQLMKQFGLSSEESYNLMAQGAQNGLNQNDDLMDTINEYSVHFKALGFSGEEMMNMIANGVDEGVFSVDKLGDSIKEFGIRSIDFSETSVKGFEMLGLDADDMFEKFNAGGDTAKQAFDEVTKKMNEVDEAAAKQAGVALFGTMFEDLQKNAIGALADTEGEISLTKDALGSINDVKYNDAGSALSALGRTINVSLAGGMSKAVNSATGYIHDFTDGLRGDAEASESTFGRIGMAISDVGEKAKAVGGFIKDNWSSISPVLMALIGAFVAVKGVMIAYNIVNGVMKAITIASTVAQFGMAVATRQKASADLMATGAQLGLNTALLACPITWIIVGIMAVIAVIVLMVVYWDEIVSVVKKVWNSIVTALAPIAQWLMDNVITPVKEFFMGLWNSIVQIFTSISTSVMNAITPVATFVYSFIMSIVSFISSILATIWSIITSFFNVIQLLIQGAWNFIMSILTPIATWIYSTVIMPTLSFFQSLWNGIVSIFSAVASWFGGIFSGAYSAVTSAFSGVVGFFSGIWDSITSLFVNIGHTIADGVSGAFRSTVNAVIGFGENIINGFVNSINNAIGFINKIPGVSISKIATLSVPRLATGGIADTSMIANIGEAGTEAVVPLENNLGWLDKMANMITQAILSKANYTPQMNENYNSSSSSIIVEEGAVQINITESENPSETAGSVKSALNDFFSDLRSRPIPVTEV